MRPVGLLLLVAAGGGIGCMRALTLQRRATMLETVQRLIVWVTARLQYTAAPVAELLRQAAALEEFCTLPLLAELQIRLKTDPFPEAWQKAVTVCVRQTELMPEDGALLRQFGEGLGKTDIEGQRQHGRMYEELFAQRHQQAQQRAKERGRVTVVLWLSGAAVLALLLA